MSARTKVERRLAVETRSPCRSGSEPAATPDDEVGRLRHGKSGQEVGVDGFRTQRLIHEGVEELMECTVGAHLVLTHTNSASTAKDYFYRNEME